MLNLDQLYNMNSRKSEKEKYKYTEWELKTRSFVSHCKPLQLCQNWRPSKSNLDASCSRSNACFNMETSDLPMCKEVIEKYSAS